MLRKAGHPYILIVTESTDRKIKYIGDVTSIYIHVYSQAFNGLH